MRAAAEFCPGFGGARFRFHSEFSKASLSFFGFDLRTEIYEQDAHGVFRKAVAKEIVAGARAAENRLRACASDSGSADPRALSQR